MKELGRNIKTIRIHRRLALIHFGEQIDVGRAYLSEIEKGLQNTTVEILIKIANGLDVPVYWLFLPADELEEKLNE